MTLGVVHQPDKARYVLQQDGEQIGMVEYVLRDGEIDFVHTEIDEERREHGMASQLVQEALDDVRDASDRRVIASCPYVRHWLREHPEYQGLLRR